MRAMSPDLRFCFLSGQGADPQEKAWSLFARVKGRTERALEGVADDLYVFRPGLIVSRPGQPRPDCQGCAT